MKARWTFTAVAMKFTTVMVSLFIRGVESSAFSAVFGDTEGGAF